MDTNLSDDSHLSEISWRNYFRSYLISGHKLPESPEFKQFKAFLWPASTDYPSTVPSIFLAQVISLHLLAQSKMWIVRDGLVPLLWFFFQNPKPPEFPVKLYVHRNLRSYVPLEWKPSFGYYDYHTRDFSESTKTVSQRPKILIFGIMMEAYVSIDGIDDHIKKIIDGLTQIRDPEVYLYLPCRGWSGAKNWLDQHYHASILKKLFSSLGSDLKILTYEDVKHLDRLNIDYFYDLNDALIMADNALLHQVLEGGGNQLSKSEDLIDQSPDHYIKCSMQYGFRLYNRLPEGTVFPTDEVFRTKEAINTHQKLFDLAKLDATRQFPWPVIFTEWSLSMKDQALIDRS